MTNAPPDRDRLDALSTDDWAVLLRLVRQVLHALHADGGDDRSGDAGREEVRASPTGALAGGKGRALVSRLLVADEQLWEQVVAQADEDVQAQHVIDELQRTGSSSTTADQTGHARDQAAEPAVSSEAEKLRRRLRRERQRLVQARHERDELARKGLKLERRVEQVEGDLARHEAALAEAHRELEDVRARLEAAHKDQQRAVARQRRRGEAVEQRLQQQLREARRALQERAVPAAQPSQGPAEPDGDRSNSTETSRSEPATRFEAGRPSRLPADVVAGTRDAVQLYLHRDRLVLIDGYNVTRQRYDHLDLEQQRTWLVQAVENLARQQKIRPVIVFDGAGNDPGGHRTRLLQVRFSPAGITADDEIVLAVEATDEPVVVVTDDLDLQERVRRSGADLVGSKQLLWLL